MNTPEDLPSSLQQPFGAESNCMVVSPEFWRDAPTGRFVYAESRFHIRVTFEVDKFDHLSVPCPTPIDRMVMVALETRGVESSYSALKQ
jgi:hypothetical protein